MEDTHHHQLSPGRPDGEMEEEISVHISRDIKEESRDGSEHQLVIDESPEESHSTHQMSERSDVINTNSRIQQEIEPASSHDGESHDSDHSKPRDLSHVRSPSPKDHLDLNKNAASRFVNIYWKSKLCYIIYIHNIKSMGSNIYRQISKMPFFFIRSTPADVLPPAASPAHPGITPPRSTPDSPRGHITPPPSTIPPIPHHLSHPLPPPLHGFPSGPHGLRMDMKAPLLSMSDQLRAMHHSGPPAITSASSTFNINPLALAHSAAMFQHNKNPVSGMELGASHGLPGSVAPGGFGPGTHPLLHPSEHLFSLSLQSMERARSTFPNPFAM